MKEEYSFAIIITGPNIALSIKPVYEFFGSKIKNVISIGDGITDINFSEASSLFGIFSSSNSTDKVSYNQKLLVFIDMHGINDDEYGHLVQHKSDGPLLKTSGLFSFLNETIQQPMDIILTSCHGKGALEDINILTNGSRIIILSESDSYTYANNYVYSLEAMNKVEEFSFESFYDNYLYHLTIQESPIIATVGGKVIDSLLAANFQLGKVISSEARLYVHEHFGKNVCQTDENCHKKIDQLMDKMEQAVSLEEFYSANKYLTEKFKQGILALEEKSESLEDDEVTNICSTPFEKLINHKNQCSALFSWLKSELDQILSKNNIPVTLNLESSLLHSDDDDDDDDDVESIWEVFSPYQNFSDRGLYDIVKITKINISCDLFILNDDILIPEYPEYGSVLGIAKDIDAFLSDSV